VHLLLAVLECLIESGGASSALGAINRGLLSKAANTIPKWPKGRESSREQGVMQMLPRGKHQICITSLTFFSFSLRKLHKGVVWAAWVACLLCNSSACRHFLAGTINLSTVLIELHRRPRQQQQQPYVAPTLSLSLQSSLGPLSYPIFPPISRSLLGPMQTSLVQTQKSWFPQRYSESIN